MFNAESDSYFVIFCCMALKVTSLDIYIVLKISVKKSPLNFTEKQMYTLSENDSTEHTCNENFHAIFHANITF